MAKVTKYTYGQFARINGKRYRVRKNKHGRFCLNKCALRENGKCRLLINACINRCILLIPEDAYFEKV